MIEVHIPTPIELRGRWAALAAVYTAYGWDDVASATEEAWFYDDMGGNWASLRFAGTDKAVLVGYDHEFSRTALTQETIKESVLLKGAPAWWSEHVYPSPEIIGFIYGWENNKWQRANYTEEDGFDYVGLLHATKLKGRHSIGEATAEMFGSANHNALAELINADANVSEDMLSRIAPSNIAEGVEAARNFLKVPLIKHNNDDSNTPQQFASIQQFITAIKSNDFDAIENSRDEITTHDIPAMIEYYKTLNDWDHKTSWIEVMCDFKDKAGQLREIHMDYLTVPESLSHPEGRVELAQATAISHIDGSDFMNYYSNPHLIYSRVDEILKENGLAKSK